MSFLNKFQYHYHSKQLDALFNSESYLELLSYLEKFPMIKRRFTIFLSNMLTMLFTV